VLYRAVGNVLWLVPAGTVAMLTPLTAGIRDRRNPAPPPRSKRPRFRPDPPDPAATHAPVPDVGFRRLIAGIDPRWRRVSYWWIFPAEQLDRMLLEL
jgi:hypothetical protein